MAKPVKLFTLSMLCLLIVMAGCDSGSSGGIDTEGGTEPGSVPTIDDLVGTWNCHNAGTSYRRRYDVASTISIVKTDDSAASFTRYTTTSTEDTKRGEETFYLAEEGRIILDGSGIMTEWVDRRKTAFSPLTDAIPWEDLENYGDSYSIAVLNSVLYYSPFKRVGTGGGLTGTWIGAYTHYYFYYSNIMEVTRVTMEITPSTISVKAENSEDGIEYTPGDAYGPSSYTKMGNVIMTDLFGATGTMQYFLSGDWLVMANPNITSTTSFGWVKE